MGTLQVELEGVVNPLVWCWEALPGPVVRCNGTSERSHSYRLVSPCQARWGLCIGSLSSG